MVSITKATPTRFRTRLDLSEKARVQACEYLNDTLAITLDLWSQIKQAHWNIKGKDFYHLHLLFDEIAGDVYDAIDLFAERVTTLSGYAYGTVRMSAKHSTLPEYPINAVFSHDHLVAIADRLAEYARHVRQGIEKANDLGDANTADLYTEISRKIDMRLWFTEAHLDGEL